MAKSIYKFVVPVLDHPNYIEIPVGSRLIKSAAFRPTAVTLWYEVDTEAPLNAYGFYTIPTGGEIPSNTEYLTSVIYNDGVLVWHVYQIV